MLTLSGLQKVENVHTNFMGTKKPCDHHLSTDWGFIILIGSLNPCPVVLPILCHYCIIFICTSFCRDVLVQGSRKGKLVLNASLRARQILEGELI